MTRASKVESHMSVTAHEHIRSTSDRSWTQSARIIQWAPDPRDYSRRRKGGRRAARKGALCLLSLNVVSGLLGCSVRHEPPQPLPVTPLVVAVAPVLNLSNRSDWDALQVTDMLALELQALPEFIVVPVDRVLAALAVQGRAAIETPADVRDLGRELKADMVIVAAITEFDPYNPPRVAMTVQCYRSRPQAHSSLGFDPVAASRQASDDGLTPALTLDGEGPFLQVQVVHDASWDATLEQLRRYAASRDGGQSPSGWRAHAQSQELFLRFSCHSAILTIRLETERYRSTRTSGAHDEALAAQVPESREGT